MSLAIVDTWQQYVTVTSLWLLQMPGNNMLQREVSCYCRYLATTHYMDKSLAIADTWQQHVAGESCWLLQIPSNNMLEGQVSG